MGLSADDLRCDCRYRVFVHPLHSKKILSHTQTAAFSCSHKKVWSSMFYTNQLNSKLLRVCKRYPPPISIVLKSKPVSLSLMIV